MTFSAVVGHAREDQEGGTQSDVNQGRPDRAVRTQTVPDDMVVAHDDQARANRVRAEPGPLRLLVTALFDVSSATTLCGDDER